MSKPSPNLPKVLYKFYAPERTEVFKNFKVRFSQVSALNDPFELVLNLDDGYLQKIADRAAKRASNPFWLAGMALQKAPQAVRTNEQAAALPALARALLSIFATLFLAVITVLLFPVFRRAMRKAMAVLVAQVAETLRLAREGLILIFSCTETWDSVPMWAHYANNHAGFAIGLDPRSAFSRVDKDGSRKALVPRKVGYFSGSAPRNNKDAMDFIVQKMDHWSYEKEWRFLSIPDEADERGKFVLGSELLLFVVNPAAIVEVIFGARCSRPYMDAVVSDVSAAGIHPAFFVVRPGAAHGFERVELSEVLRTADAERSETPVPTLASLPYENMYSAFKSIEQEAKDNWLTRWFSRQLRGHKANPTRDVD